MSDVSTVEVALDPSYPIIIGTGLLGSWSSCWPAVTRWPSCISRCSRRPQKRFETRWWTKGIDAHRIEIPDAEAGKDLPSSASSGRFWDASASVARMPW